MAKTGRQSFQFMLRLPDELRDRLKLKAEEAGRSVTAEILVPLEDTFDKWPQMEADLLRLVHEQEAEINDLREKVKAPQKEIATWKERFEEEHHAFLRMEHLFTEQMRLAEDYVRHMRRRNIEIYQQAGIIESLAGIVLAIDTAPTEEIRALATKMLEAAKAVKRSYPTDYDAMMARKQEADPSFLAPRPSFSRDGNEDDLPF